MSLSQENGTYVIRELTFKFKDLVTAAQFKPLRDLRVKHDNIERSGEIKDLSEQQAVEMENEWYRVVIETGLENETLETVEAKLSPGEIRTLVAVTYNFLWTFGSIDAARQSATTLRAIQSKSAQS